MFEDNNLSSAMRLGIRLQMAKIFKRPIRLIILLLFVLFYIVKVPIIPVPLVNSKINNEESETFTELFQAKTSSKSIDQISTIDQISPDSRDQIYPDSKVKVSSNSKILSIVRFQPLLQEKKSSLNFSDDSKVTFSFHLSGDSVGFGSYLNNALNALVLASEFNAPFTLYINDWAYGSLAEFIDAPQFIRERKRMDGTVVVGSEVKFPKCETTISSSKKYSDSKAIDGIPLFPSKRSEFLSQIGKRDSEHEATINYHFCPFGNALWVPFRDLTGSYMGELGRRAAYQKKADLTQTFFWKLQGKYQNFIDFVVQNHPDFRDPQRVFFSVHIRRGDKIDAGEMQSHSSEEYFNRIDKRLKQSGHQTAVIFIFSDDHVAALDLKDYITKSTKSLQIHVLLLEDIYGFVVGSESISKNSPIYEPKDFDLKPLQLLRNGFRQGSLADVGQDFRVKLARDMILSLAITRYCDYFVGTFSSNVGRLAALLRFNTDLETNESLDDEWYNV